MAKKRNEFVFVFKIWEVFLLIIALFILGFISNSLIYFEENQKTESECPSYDGIWARVNAGTEKGDWVCVNIDGMSYERAIEVCKHETGHEIFAEAVEKMNDTELKNLFEVIE